MITLKTIAIVLAIIFIVALAAACYADSTRTNQLYKELKHEMEEIDNGRNS